MFSLISLQTCKDIIDHLKPTFCPYDSIPSHFFKQIVDTIGPDLVFFINMCLSTGTVPDCLKHASVTPLLRKPNLDVSDLGNFRPISNLPFISKILEKVVFTQLHSFLDFKSLYDTFQSGFRKLYSTESALLKVTNDIMLATDNGSAVALVLLDLSSAFDMVDHSILISRLENLLGFQGTVLNWFQSFLTNRMFSVCIGKYTSSTAHLSCGVPQGSILAPTLFSLYLLPLGSIFSKYGVSFHLYADDTQLYIPFKHNDSRSIEVLLACFHEVKICLSHNFLALNENKTEVILFGPSDSYDFGDLDLGDLSPHVPPCAKNLGVLFDSGLKFDKQINSVVKSCFYHLRRLAKVKPVLSLKNFEIVIHAFVTLSRRMRCPFLRQHIYYLLKQHEKHRLNKERFPLRVHDTHHVLNVISVLLVSY